MVPNFVFSIICLSTSPELVTMCLLVLSNGSIPPPLSLFWAPGKELHSSASRGSDWGLSTP